MNSNNRILPNRMLLIGLSIIFMLLIGLVLLAIWHERTNVPQTEGQVTTFATGTSPPESSVPSTGTQIRPIETEPTFPFEERQPDQTEPSVIQPPETQPHPTQHPPETVTEPPPTEMPEEIEILQFAVYSGVYVEDGRDELVENVVAILVTNNTDKFLELADITCDTGGKTAVFRITGLPAGRSAWIMEKNRMTISGDTETVRLDTVTSFRGDVSAAPEQIKLYIDGNVIKAENRSDKVLNSVCVYYKVLHTDGNFLGGITYMVDFGTLEPGASAASIAGHFSEDAEIVRIGFSEASDRNS